MPPKELLVGHYGSQREADEAKGAAEKMAALFGRQLSFSTRIQVVGVRGNGKVTGRTAPTEKLEPCPECGRSDFTWAAGRSAHIRSHKGRTTPSAKGRKRKK